jgi:hypothetical protein
LRSDAAAWRVVAGNLVSISGGIVGVTVVVSTAAVT